MCLSSVKSARVGSWKILKSRNKVKFPNPPGNDYLDFSMLNLRSPVALSGSKCKYCEYMYSAKYAMSLGGYSLGGCASIKNRT